MRERVCAAHQKAKLAQRQQLQTRAVPELSRMTPISANIIRATAETTGYLLQGDGTPCFQTQDAYTPSGGIWGNAMSRHISQDRTLAEDSQDGPQVMATLHINQAHQLGFVNPRMVRAELLYTYLWQFLHARGRLPPQQPEETSSSEPREAMAAEAEEPGVFLVKEIQRAMPLSLFCQVMGMDDGTCDVDDIKKRCLAGQTLNDLTNKQYELVVSRKGKGFSMILQSLKLLKLLVPYITRDTSPEAVITGARFKLLPVGMLEEPVVTVERARGGVGENTAAFELQQHHYKMDSLENVDAYFTKLRAVFIGKRDEEAYARAFPATCLPDVFNNSNWSKHRLMTMQQRMALHARVQAVRDAQEWQARIAGPALKPEEAASLALELGLETIQVNLYVSSEVLVQRKDTMRRGISLFPLPRHCYERLTSPSRRKVKPTASPSVQASTRTSLLGILSKKPNTKRPRGALGNTKRPRGALGNESSQAEAAALLKRRRKETAGPRLRQSSAGKQCGMEVKEVGKPRLDKGITTMVAQRHVSKAIDWTEEQDEALVIGLVTYRSCNPLRRRIDWGQIEGLPHSIRFCKQRLMYIWHQETAAELLRALYRLAIHHRMCRSSQAGQPVLAHNLQAPGAGEAVPGSCAEGGGDAEQQSKGAEGAPAQGIVLVDEGPETREIEKKMVATMKALLKAIPRTRVTKDPAASPAPHSLPTHSGELVFSPSPHSFAGVKDQQLYLYVVIPNLADLIKMVLLAAEKERVQSDILQGVFEQFSGAEIASAYAVLHKQELVMQEPNPAMPFKLTPWFRVMTTHPGDTVPERLGEQVPFVESELEACSVGPQSGERCRWDVTLSNYCTPADTACLLAAAAADEVTFEPLRPAQALDDADAMDLDPSVSEDGGNGEEGEGVEGGTGTSGREGMEGLEGRGAIAGQPQAAGGAAEGTARAAALGAAPAVTQCEGAAGSTGDMQTEEAELLALAVQHCSSTGGWAGAGVVHGELVSRAYHVVRQGGGWGARREEVAQQLAVPEAVAESALQVLESFHVIAGIPAMDHLQYCTLTHYSRFVYNPPPAASRTSPECSPQRNQEGSQEGGDGTCSSIPLGMDIDQDAASRDCAEEASAGGSILRPWLALQGGLNLDFVRALQRRIVGFILKAPGCTASVIIAHVVGIQPQGVMEMLEMLVRDGCIQARAAPRNESLFAAAVPKLLRPNDHTHEPLKAQLHYFVDPKLGLYYL
ncbi:hypothetical protein CYMTET_50192 [Cymbomonas tetramitiformis]|uniref:DUF7647 domain-containing protein n=1 Tax=Cymbomonas tetramitiformis TaxID=36881 RepID=A0AAE0BQA3_9CHLO|nr:hypothetical protein CYMTET_50192 [Cymbomonas tetramitiformis]